MKKEKIIFYLSVIYIGLSLSCNNEKLRPRELKIGSYKAMVTDTLNPITIVTLLHSYPMAKLNNNNSLVVNLYVCKKNSSRDSILVFDVNKPAGRLFLETEFNGTGFIINSINIKEIKTESVVINVPSNFITPNKIEYVFARIDKTSD